jgi:hypothetical protein
MTQRRQRALEAQIDGDAEIEFLRVLGAAIIGRSAMDLLLTRQDLRLDALFWCLSDDFAWWAGVCGYSEEELPAMRRKLVQRWKDALAGMKA